MDRVELSLEQCHRLLDVAEERDRGTDIAQGEAAQLQVADACRELFRFIEVDARALKLRRHRGSARGAPLLANTQAQHAEAVEARRHAGLVVEFPAARERALVKFARLVEFAEPCVHHAQAMQHAGLQRCIVLRAQQGEGFLEAPQRTRVLADVEVDGGDAAKAAHLPVHVGERAPEGKPLEVTRERIGVRTHRQMRVGEDFDRLRLRDGVVAGLGEVERLPAELQRTFRVADTGPPAGERKQ